MVESWAGRAVGKALRHARGAAKRRRVRLRDDDGEYVEAGDRVRFNYGIPPVLVVGPVVQDGCSLFVLTSGHTPERCNLRSLRRYVGVWYKERAC